MAVINSLCEAYHWSFEQAMQRTMPQILMLNHASWAAQKRIEAKVKRSSGTDEDDEPRVEGKKFDEMTSDQWMRYYGSDGAGVVIGG